MIVLEIDAPQRTRVCVAFNGDARGLVIRADKAREDARNFRAIAALVRKAQFAAPALQAEAARAASALCALADQFDMAADGRNPQAR